MDLETINTRPKSPHRNEQAFKYLTKVHPPYRSGVLIGDWVEKLDAPVTWVPEESPPIPCAPESRASDGLRNKIKDRQDRVDFNQVPGCRNNFTTTYDLVYNHLPKPLYGPNYRIYLNKRGIYHPQPDLAICHGNLTSWGLQRYLEYEWKLSEVSDEIATLYQETYVDFGPGAMEKNRKARDASFTKSFRSLHGK